MPKITEEQIKNMANYRKQEINHDYPILNPEDFSSEDEYKKALMEQYKALSQERYEYTVMNECMKVYNVSCDGRNKGIPENQGFWTAYQGQGIEVGDSAVNRAPDIATAIKKTPSYMIKHKNKDKNGNVTSIGAHCCSITSTAIESQVCAKMGYDDKNIIQPTEDTPFASAKSAATGVDPKYQIQGRGKNLNYMIAHGQLPVGSGVSLIKGEGDNNTSGCHAVTIAAINYDENHNVTSYTLQANNSCQLQTYSINSGYGTQIVHNAVNLQKWADDRVQEKLNEMENLPPERVAEMVNSQRQDTMNVIDNLQTTETYAATHTRNNKQYIEGISSHYQKDLNAKEQLFQTPIPMEEQTQNQTPVPQEEQTQDQTPVPPRDVTLVANEETGHTNTAEDLKNQHGEAITDPASDFKEGFFDKEVTLRTQPETTDDLPVNESMKAQAEEHNIPVITDPEKKQPVFREIETGTPTDPNKQPVNTETNTPTDPNKQPIFREIETETPTDPNKQPVFREIETSTPTDPNKQPVNTGTGASTQTATTPRTMTVEELTKRLDAQRRQQGNSTQPNTQRTNTQTNNEQVISMTPEQAAAYLQNLKNQRR